jgi:hypothetical protein
MSQTHASGTEPRTCGLGFTVRGTSPLTDAKAHTDATANLQLRRVRVSQIRSNRPLRRAVSALIYRSSHAALDALERKNSPILFHGSRVVSIEIPLHRNHTFQ